MKYILTRFFDFFKLASTKVYTVVATLLLYTQAQLTDPQVIQEIIALFPDQPSIAKIIQMLPTIILALCAPKTQQKMDQYRATKKPGL
jgi:hypothetical protein